MGVSSLPVELTDEGYARAMDLAAEVGELVLVKRAPPWEEFVPGGQVSDATAAITERERALIRERNLELFFAIDPTDPADRGRLAGLPERLRGAGFAHPDIQHALLAYAQYVVKNYRPRYLALATDVNLYARIHPEDFDAFVQLYGVVYDAVKAVAPETAVFVTFQYEDLNGLLPTVEEHSPDWDLVGRFGDRLDLFAISTYPSLAFQRVKAIPADYYTRARRRVSLPLAVAEMGYSSGPGRRGLNPGTEPLQEEFLVRILLEAEALQMRFVVWLAAWDLPYATDPPLDTFRYVGLRREDGSPKPAWEVWERAARRPLEPARRSRRRRPLPAYASSSSSKRGRSFAGIR
ncbi:MAG TPA: hypothetical protein VNN12_06555 [Dehalococcoidia bacterium]|jgi:hypothetical protein|nr:hypothetical protein [Dehalococcoidia bacterium]